MVSTDFYLAPELIVPLTAADYAGVRDAALDATLTYRPAAARLSEELDRAQQSDAGVAIACLMTQPINRHLNTEPVHIESGYAAVRAGDYSRAPAAFEGTRRAYPESANTFDSLGDGYRAAGRTAEAIAAHRRALVIAPNYRPSLQSLSQLSVVIGAWPARQDENWRELPVAPNARVKEP